MSQFKFAFKVFSICAIGLTMTLGSVVADENDDNLMTIGSKAPDIDIEHWISDNDGAFEHTTTLSSGQVYVIEFWATWCGPCIAAMPHIADLQKKYGQEVQVISISDEDMETVEKFLARDVRGKEGVTYADLTSTYCLTTDPDRSVLNDYFRASGRTGIPCAFVVGKTGLVEWIGHPASMDNPLKQVVNDEWNREEFLVKYKKEQEERMAAMKARRLMAKAGRKIQELVNDGEYEEAVEYLGELLSDDEYKGAHEQLSAMKLHVLVTNNLDGAADALEDFAKENGDKAQLLSQIARVVYDQHDKEGNVSEALLKSACNCAKVAAEKRPKSGVILDTYAHLVYAAHNDLEKAIEVQKKAVENPGRKRKSIQSFLDQLLEEKEGAN